MAGGLLPPFGEPAGERADDATVLSTFVQGVEASVHSDRFHVEGTAHAVLVAGGDVAMALRVAPQTFLLRVDLPEDLAPARRAVEDAFAGNGITFLDGETLLAAPVTIQVLGLRVSTWDLWGADIDESFGELRRAAVGEWDDVFPEGPPPLGGPPS